MPDERNPTWATFWDLFIKTLGIVGALFLYATHGCEFNQTTRSLAKLELEVKNEAIKASQLQTQLSSFIQEQHSAETRLANAEESKIQSELSPRVVVTPALESISLGQSLQQVKLSLSIANIGNMAAKIGGAEVDVFRGTFSIQAVEVIRKADQLFRIEQRLAIGIPEESQALQAEYDRLHADCPHGKIYLIDDDAEVFAWTETAKLEQPADYELGPGQAVKVEFDLMSTHFYGHPIWLRFDPYVQIDGKRQGFGQLLLPVQSIGTSSSNQYVVAKSVRTGTASKVVFEAKEHDEVDLTTESLSVQIPILPSTSSNATRVAE